MPLDVVDLCNSKYINSSRSNIDTIRLQGYRDSKIRVWVKKFFFKSFENMKNSTCVGVPEPAPPAEGWTAAQPAGGVHPLRVQEHHSAPGYSHVP